MNPFIDWMPEKFSTCFTIFCGLRNILIFYIYSLGLSEKSLFL